MNALIIEDEKLVAQELAASIADVDPNINLAGTVGSVKTALSWFAQHAEPDLVFADIQLVGGVSFTLKGLANVKLQLALKTPDQRAGLDISRDNAPSFRKWPET